MASYSFALSPGAYYGDPTANVMARGWMTGMNNGINFANRLYDLQNRVALDPYAVSAAGSQLQEQDYASRLGGEFYGEMLRQQLSGYNKPRPTYNQPGAVTPGGDSAAATQYGNPQRLEAAFAQNAAARAMNPDLGSVREDAFAPYLHAPYRNQQIDWLTGGW